MEVAINPMACPITTFQILKSLTEEVSNGLTREWPGVLSIRTACIWVQLKIDKMAKMMMR